MTAALTELSNERIEPAPKLTFRAFADLNALPQEPNWLWDGILAEGSLTIVSGHPFVGKTMLVAGLVKAMESGMPFLGRRTTPATAVLVSEEHHATLQPRAARLGLYGLRSEFASRSDGIFRVGWDLLVEQATTRALQHGHKLLVLDTFAGLAGLRAEEENDAGAISERLQPLHIAASEGLAVVLLHHLNKNGQTRGSTAFRGGSDTSIRMHRQQKGADFRLEIESRFPTIPIVRGRLVASESGVTYESAVRREPSGAASSELDVEKRLLSALRQGGQGGVTYEEIARIPGLSIDIAKKRLTKLLGTNVGRVGKGRKGDPYRWFLVDPCEQSRA